MSDDEDQFVVLSKEELLDYNTQNVLPQSAAVQDEIQAWLDPTDYSSSSSEYQRHLNSYVHDTCSWLQTDARFRQWRDSKDNSLLWIKAIPGAGKTVLAASTIQNIAEEEENVVLYFFFRQIIESNRQLKYLLRDFLSQLLPFSPNLQRSLKSLKENSQAVTDLTVFSLAEELFKALATCESRVYVVIDAIDEMVEDRDSFRDLLNQLTAQRSKILKLFLTARPNDDIHRRVRAPTNLEIRLDPSSMATPISTFIAARLQASDLQHLEPPVKVKIQNGICHKANGLFLYARFLVDQVILMIKRAQTTNIDDFGLLENLPLELEDTYSQTLQNCAQLFSNGFEYQKLLLELVVLAYRPLRVNELTHGLQTYFPELALAGNARNVVRGVCGPLLEILNDETVQPVHHSFVEYLFSSAVSVLRTGRRHLPILNRGEAQRNVTMLCIKYLNAQLSEVQDNRSHTERYRAAYDGELAKERLSQPFLQYATSAWYLHLKTVDSYDPEMFGVLDQFLSNQSRIDNWSIRMFHPKNDWYYVDIPSQFYFSSVFTPIHIAAFAGLSNYLEHLLLNEYDINALDYTNKSPLHWASREGHVHIVESLIHHGADLNNVDDFGLRPIHLAALGDHAAVVRILISAKVDPLTLTGLSRKVEYGDMQRFRVPSEMSILDLISQKGHLRTLTEMISHTSPEALERPLCLATRANKVEFVRKLLEKTTVSPNSELDGQPVLHLALQNMSFSCIETLIKKGADVNKLSKPALSLHMEIPYGCESVVFWRAHGNALHALVESTAQNYHRFPTIKLAESILNLLLQSGVDLEAKNELGKPALLSFSLDRSAHSDDVYDFLRLLVEVGCDASNKDVYGETILHLLADRFGTDPNHPPVLRDLVSFLVRHGADNNAQNRGGETPLFRAMLSGNMYMMETLLQSGAGVNIKLGGKQTALMYVCRFFSWSGNIWMFQTLFASGADPNITNESGQTCGHVIPNSNANVFATHSSDIYGTFNVLVENGLNLELGDLENGYTALVTKVRDNDTIAIEALLKLGAQIETRDFRGRTCIHHVRNTEVLAILIKYGADVSWTDSDGNTPLHTTAMDAEPADPPIKLWEEFIHLGADPCAQNNAGQTFLHFAYPRLFDAERLFSVLMDLGYPLDVNLKDNAGFTPLHYAAVRSDEQVFTLYSRGAHLNAVSIDGRTPLHVACRARKPNVVRTILRLCRLEDLSLVESSDLHGRTALHDACRSGEVESVRLLLEAGANALSRDNALHTPLHVCAEINEEYELWAVLQRTDKVSKGIKLSDKWRPTAKPQVSSFKSMVKKHDIKLTNSPLRPIHHEDVISRGQLFTLVKTLLDFGAETEQVDEANKIPIELASQARFDALVTILTNEAIEKPASTDPLADLKLKLIPIAAFPGQEPLIEKWLSELTQSAQPKLQIMELLRSSRPEDFALIFDKSSPEVQLEVVCQLIQHGAVYAFNEKFLSATSFVSLEWLKKATFDWKTASAKLLFAACERETYNLEAVKFVVNVLKVDVNSYNSVENVHRVQIRVWKSPKPGQGQTIIHFLSQGWQAWHVEALELLISNGADLTLRDKDGRTPLHHACSIDPAKCYFRDQVVTSLLQKGADPNVQDMMGLTCLDKSVKDRRLYKILISNGAGSHLEQTRLLSVACRDLDLDLTTFLLRVGADCNKAASIAEQRYDQSQWNQAEVEAAKAAGEELAFLRDYEFVFKETFPLLEASLFPYPDKLKLDTQQKASHAILGLLLEHGADPLVRLSNGNSVLFEIIKNKGVLQPLLKRFPGQSCWDERYEDGKTLLLEACHHTANAGFDIPLREEPTFEEHPVRLLIGRGADYTLVDNRRRGVLHHLMQEFGSTTRPLANWLLSLESPSIDISAQDDEGCTVLHRALKPQRGRGKTLELCEDLLNHGVDSVNTDASGNTPLHYLAPQLVPLFCPVDSGPGTPEIFSRVFQKCISRGADIDAKNTNGETPLFCCFQGYLNLLERMRGSTGDLLNFTREIFQDADWSAKDAKGRTLLHVVAGCETHEIWRWKEILAIAFKMLVDRGLDPTVEDNARQSSLDYAEAFGNERILELFHTDDATAPKFDVAESIKRFAEW